MNSDMGVSAEDSIRNAIMMGAANSSIASVLKVISGISMIELGRLRMVNVPMASKQEKLMCRLIKRQFPELKLQVKESVRRFGMMGAWDVIEAAFNELANRGWKEVGIFRLKQSSKRTEELYQMMCEGGYVDFKNELCHDIANALKMYLLRRLPRMLEIEDIEEVVATRSLARVYMKWNDEQKKFISLLGQLCRRIDALSGVNRMDMGNLARVIGPNMFQHEDPKVEFDMINKTIEATRLILTHFD